MQSIRRYLVSFSSMCIALAPAWAEDVVVARDPSQVAADAVASFKMKHPDRILVIGIIDDGVRHFFTAGEMGEGRPAVAETTLFEIGSISKTFVGTSLAALVDDGVLSYDQTVSEFVPETIQLDSSVAAIRLEQLATHTSGLPRVARSRILKSIFSMTPYGGSRETLDWDLSLLKVEPTEHPSYSNMGVGLLGDILSRVEGKSLEEVIRERVTSPLQLNDTVVQLSDDQTSRFAAGYFGDSKAKPWSNMGTGTGAGGIRSTASDLLTYAEAVMASPHGVVGPAFAESVRPRVLYETGQWAIGLCWHSVIPDDGTPVDRPAVVFHNGATYSHVSALVIEPDAKRAAVVFINGIGRKHLPQPLSVAQRVLGHE